LRGELEIQDACLNRLETVANLVSTRVLSNEKRFASRQIPAMLSNQLCLNVLLTGITSVVEDQIQLSLANRLAMRYSRVSLLHVCLHITFEHRNFTLHSDKTSHRRATHRERKKGEDLLEAFGSSHLPANSSAIQPRIVVVQMLRRLKDRTQGNRR